MYIPVTKAYKNANKKEDKGWINLYRTYLAIV
jgi:hypothetical protein